jgi:hypothetical protein
MHGSLELTFPYSAREHVDAYLASRPGRRLRLLVQAPGMFIGGCAILATVLSALNSESGFWIQATSLISLAAVWVLAAPVLLKQVALRRCLRDSKSEGRVQETRLISVDGFVPSARWAHSIPWSDIDVVEETPQFFLIEATSDDVSYIPKQSLSLEQTSRLRSMLPRISPRSRWPWAT